MSTTAVLISFGLDGFLGQRRFQAREMKPRCVSKRLWGLLDRLESDEEVRGCEGKGLEEGCCFMTPGPSTHLRIAPGALTTQTNIQKGDGKRKD